VSAGAEYRYTDWGSKGEDLNTFLAPPGTVDDEVTQHAVRLLVSYRF
jgi:opacity protein-like surface antigen